jgi:hypothetical protein
MKLSLYSRNSFDLSQVNIICELEMLKDKKACINFILEVDNYHNTGEGWYITNGSGVVVYNKAMYKGIPDFIQFIKRREEICYWGVYNGF